MAEEIIIVQGNNTLAGDVAVSGAKNSALKLIAAALLGQGETTIHNVPLISDISIMSDVLRCLGARVERDGHTLTVDTSAIDKHETPYELVSKMRASISVLGPLVGRFGCARVAMPGGCQIGARKIDMHLVGLEAIGVEFSIDHGFLEASTPNGLHGAHVVLDFPSVGATENLLMAAVAAEGSTVIENAAREPEIVDLANMLVSMGARRGRGLGHHRGRGRAAFFAASLRAHDGGRPHRGRHLPGRRRADGRSRHRARHRSVVSARCAHEAPRHGLRRGDGRRLDHRGPHAPAGSHRLADAAASRVSHRPSGAAAFADGMSVITENVFENRFMFASELMRMGADIAIEDHHALVRGVDVLQGADVSSTDLRAGAALVLAGIAGEGETRVHNIGHIDRGYEDYVGKLRALGADVVRAETEQAQTSR